MANTIQQLMPFSAEFPSASFPQLTLINQRPVLGYDASTAESAVWTFVARQSLGTTLTLILFYMMASATSGNVNFTASVEAVTPGDATDLDAGDSFDTANDGGADAVPAVAGYLGTQSITLTTKDSIAAGDLVRVKIARDATDATNDTATGDAYLLLAELQDA